MALMRQHESTRDLEHVHLSKLHRLRVEQMQEQHGVENLNQQEYTKRLKQELLAQHAAEHKQIPKNAKVSPETLISEIAHLLCVRVCEPLFQQLEATFTEPFQMLVSTA